MDATSIITAIKGVTGKWAKQRKAEERERSREFRRRDALTRSERVTIRAAAFEIMEQSYLKASTNDTYPAHARQIMYAARGQIQRMTGRVLDDDYFTQTLLPDYLSENPETTSGWDVVFDARGHFTEPHTESVVPLGTLDVRSYLAAIESHAEKTALDIELDSGSLFPTCGPKHRYSAVLFIEKEGFMPLFKAARLAERFDIAIMSTKGMSVTASRLLVDRLCGEHQIPLLVLHDFDKSGFSIVGTLKRDTRRYRFQSEIDVIDLGLRLPDIEKWGLQDEGTVYGKSDPTSNLRENGATEEEIAFILDREASRWRHYVGRRVELNAFASGDLLTWIEEGLHRHGIKKLVPDSETLKAAFRRAATRAFAERNLQNLIERAEAEAAALKLPRTLERHIKARMKNEPALPWDTEIAEIVAKLVSTAR